MGSEKSSTIICFDSVAEADRRVAGVAAAARIARQLSEQGADRILLALPRGERLRQATLDDLSRLTAGADIAIVDADREVEPDVPAIRAPRLDAAAMLRATGKASDGPVSRWLNRPISRRISAWLLHIPGIRPIHATIGTALLAGAMFAALLIGGRNGLIAGGLLFHAASVFDGVDGEIARATFRSSAQGAAIDTAVDIATNLLFILGLTIGLARVGPAALLVGGWGFLLFVIGLGALALGAAHTGRQFSLEGLKDRYRHRFPGRVVPLVIAGATIVSSRDFFALLFALLILAGTPMAVLYIFAGAATVWLPIVILSLIEPAGSERTRRSA